MVQIPPSLPPSSPHPLSSGESPKDKAIALAEEIEKKLDKFTEDIKHNAGEKTLEKDHNQITDLLIQLGEVGKNFPLDLEFETSDFTLKADGALIHALRYAFYHDRPKSQVLQELTDLQPKLSQLLQDIKNS